MDLLSFRQPRSRHPSPSNDLTDSSAHTNTHVNPLCNAAAHGSYKPDPVPNEDTLGTYDEQRQLLCVGSQPTDYIGTDPEGCHHFRCPREGCCLKHKVD